MERMEETVAGADDQRLQHMLTESLWDHRAVLDQLAQEADHWLGGTEEDNLPLLSCSDIESLLRSFLPRRDVMQGEVLRQMEKRHRKRQAAIDSQYRKQMREQLVSA